MASLTLLLPDPRRIAGSASLARWCARGDRLAEAKPGREAVLREAFEFIGTSMPAAALTRSLDANDATQAQWLRADPCHVVVDAVAVRMLACGELGLGSDESAELARALRPLFGDAGFPLEASLPQRWYLRCAADARLPRFAPPEAVLGDDLLQHLPLGDNERQWRHLLNEAQVILHNHPLNAQRVQRGQLAANSVWFWGGGKLPQWVRTRYTRVVSGELVVTALARAAKIPEQPGVAQFQLEPNDAVLLDLADCRDASSFEHHWGTLLDAALRRGNLKVLQLRYESGATFLYKPWHRWRFWRRSASA